MLWDLWVPRSRGGHWLMQQERAGALTWSSWGKQKNAIRDNSGDSSQASAKTCISKTLRSSDHKNPNSKSTPHVKAGSKDISSICPEDRLALQAQKRRAAGPVAWPRCAEAGLSGQCEAAQPRPRPAAESLRLDNWLDQDAYFLRKLMWQHKNRYLGQEL